MDTALHELIRNFRSDDGNYTHVSFYGPASKWYINNNELGNFWLEYCRNVYDRSGNFCLGEKAHNTPPVLVKCSLEFDYSGDCCHPYDEDFILSVVSCYQQSMLELLQISESCVELTCCVLEQDKLLNIDGKMTCQFILQFPYCRVEASFQNNILRPQAIRLLRMEKVVSRLFQQPINDWDSIISDKVLIEPWPLYKSKTHPDQPELLISHIYGPIKDEHIENKEGPDLDINDVFNPAYHQSVQSGVISKTIFSENTDGMFWLPMFLSLFYYHCIVKLKDDVSRNSSQLSAKNSKLSSSSLTTSGEITPNDMVEALMPLLSRERKENYGYWIDVGKCLYNAYKGDEQGLHKWIQFTETTDEHTAEECKSLYPTFDVENALTVKTLAWYAKIDSPDEYKNWHNKWCNSAFVAALSLAHVDVAEALYRSNWLEFICANAEKNRWYQYSQHKWTPQDDGINLRKMISSNFLRVFEEMRTSLSKEINDTNDENFKNSGELTIAKICKLIKQLKSMSYIYQIMRAAKDKFHDENFDRVSDSNTDILGVSNGVIEIVNEHAVFRDGKPEDYISKSANIFYKRTLNWEDPNVIKCMKWLGQVFVDHKLLAYFLKLSSSCLRAKNSEKLFPILTGMGDNSKSMVKKLFEAAFGTYCVTFPTSLITTRRTSSSAPTPEMAQAKSARVGFLQEPDSDDTIRNGILKELTGGDKFFTRKLNENGGPIEATFKLFLMCNKVPMIPNSDKAVKNRLRIVPFLSTWSKNAPDCEEEQYKSKTFKMDPFFEKCIPQLAAPFMWILVQYYSKYIEEGIKEPKMVKEYTEHYWSENDVYNQFIAECLVSALKPDGTPDVTYSITISEIYQEFKSWFKNTYSDIKVPTRDVLGYELIQRWGKPIQKKWTGVKFASSVANIPEI